MRKYVLCPVYDDGYDDRVRLYFDDVPRYAAQTGVYVYALLDAYNGDYLGQIELH